MESVIERIGCRARVYVAQGSATPYGLLAGLDAAHDRFEQLEFVSAFLLERPAPLNHLGNPCRWISLQPSGALRDALDTPHFGVVPARYSDITGLVGPGGGLEAGVLLCQASPPDANGRMINDACIDLIDGGAIDNRHKGPLGDGVSVAAEVMGTRRLDDWVDRNPAVYLANGSLSHGIEGIAQVRNFVALQSTVQMALHGSANSEVIGGRYISGPGGAPDFAFGACVATGGRAIVAMPSTAAGGRISRIVAVLEAGAPVTLPAYTADIVATEFGAVELRGRTLAERADLLISIAHPDFRDELSQSRPA